MLRLRDIDPLVLRVVDLDAMMRFHCDVLGCTVERRREKIGPVMGGGERSAVPESFVFA